MFVLLCGYPPFFGDSDSEVLAKAPGLGQVWGSARVFFFLRRKGHAQVELWNLQMPLAFFFFFRFSGDVFHDWDVSAEKPDSEWLQHPSLSKQQLPEGCGQFDICIAAVASFPPLCGWF